MADNTKPVFDSVHTYHGEPSPEVNAAIWAKAEDRCPDNPTWQSAFNDGAHYIVQALRDSCAEIVRLHGLLDANGCFTDKAAFAKFNSDYTAAHRLACQALTSVLGAPAMDALNFQPVEADATVPYESEDG